MKILITLCLMTVGLTSHQAQGAITCSANTEVQIAQTADCLGAINIAEACASGTSSDMKLEAAANKVCASKEMKNVPKSDLELRKSMEKRCMLICNLKTDKSRCLSKMSMCQLSAIKYMLHFYTP